MNRNLLNFVSALVAVTSVSIFQASLAGAATPQLGKTPIAQAIGRTQQLVMTESNEAPLAYSTDGTFVSISDINGKTYVIKGKSLRVDRKTKSYIGTITHRRLAIVDAETVVLTGKLENYNQPFTSKLNPSQQFGQKTESLAAITQTKFANILRVGGLGKATKFDLLEIADWIMENFVN
jgi:hypothetical protein